jgi:hypothetical protein
VLATEDPVCGSKGVPHRSWRRGEGLTGGPSPSLTYNIFFSKNFFIKKNSYLSFAFDSCLHVFFDYLQEALVQCTGVFCYICCSMFTWSTDWVGDPGISTRDSFLYSSMETVYLLFIKKFLYLPYQQTMRATNSFTLYDTPAKTVVGRTN